MKRTKNEQVARGRRAETILEDPLVAEAFEEIDKAIFKEFRDTALDDKESREAHFLMLRGMDLFKTRFEKLVRTGKTAEIEIQHKVKSEKKE